MAVAKISYLHLLRLDRYQRCRYKETKVQRFGLPSSPPIDGFVLGCASDIVFIMADAHLEKNTTSLHEDLKSDNTHTVAEHGHAATDTYGYPISLDLN